MKVIETGFRLNDEAYLESRFTGGLNILFSDDNNKGKTLVIQGLMYSLGNQPIFPTGFNYRDATFYSKCDFNGIQWSFLRRYNSIIAESNGQVSVFDSLSEFKHFYNASIAKLPIINKDLMQKVADLELVFQLFFLPQDRRNASNVISSGYYKKSDFYEMLYSISGNVPEPLNSEQIAVLKQELAKMLEERKIYEKRFTFAKSHPALSQLVNKSTDRDAAKVKREIIGSINSRLSELERDRTREENRKAKLERLIIELHSLNRELSAGKVKCADCGSNKIIYKNDEFSFDVSNTLVRNEIFASIKKQLAIKQEIIEEKTRLMNLEQDALRRELQFIPKSVQTILLHAEEISSAAEIDDMINDVDMRITEIKASIDVARTASTDKKKINKDIIVTVLDEMNALYKQLDPDGLQFFEDIFAKRDQTYSGSEEQEFYFVKIAAINSVLNQDYPIIIDSFRSGELSSQKEEFMINYFAKLSKQVILSSTLKNEEYSANRYSAFQIANAIDYSAHQNSHILNSRYREQFAKIESAFMVLPN